MMTVKEKVHKLVDHLPDDSSFDEILKELAFSRMVERGLDDVAQGRVISDEQMGREIESWSR